MECDAVPPVPPPPDPPDPPVTNAPTKRSADVLQSLPPAKKVISSQDDLNVPSIQTVYTHPSIVVGAIQAYTSLDKGPFIVNVSRVETDPTAGTIIKPIKFGQFLATNRFANVCPGEGVKKVGRNKVSVEFTSADSANKFITSPILPMAKYVPSIPTYNVTRMGLVRNVPTDLSMDEFAKDVVLPDGCGIILKARRLNRKVTDDGKVSWVPTQTVVITFQGQYLPPRIFLYYNSLPVELYQYPTIQCHTCCRFGHTKTQCRSKPRCFRCSKEHSGDSCKVQEANASCLHCSGRHFSTSKNCPEQERQKSIKMVMAQNSISYEEASRQFPKTTRSFAEIAQEDVANPIPFNSLRKPVSAGPSHLPPRSYVKTVYATSKPKAPLDKSYDRTAHREIITHPSTSLPNGCATSYNQLAASPNNDNLIETLLSLLIDIILKKPQSLPSNVASKLTQLVAQFSSNGSSGSSPVEHPEHACKNA